VGVEIGIVLVDVIEVEGEVEEGVCVGVGVLVGIGVFVGVEVTVGVGLGGLKFIMNARVFATSLFPSLSSEKYSIEYAPSSDMVTGVAYSFQRSSLMLYPE